MPLLDIATAQASLQNRSTPLRAQSLFHCKVFSSLFTFGDNKQPISIRKSLHFPKKPNATKLQIKAVATLEPKCSAEKEEKNAEIEVGSEVSSIAAEADTSDVDEKELLRRNRISTANKGKAPWNKGRKHSPETLRKIRERTKVAMQNPKIKEKLANLGHSQSEETRSKIGVGVRMTWKKRHERIMVQERCYYKWQNLVAEASRRGYVGEEEMQWDSYKTLSEKLKAEWVGSIEHRKTTPWPKGSKRAPKSPEHRRKIAEAIAAKWVDTEYRELVTSALSKYHGSRVGAERSPRRRTSTKRSSNVNDSTRNVVAIPIQRVTSRSKAPEYKDPMAKSKLHMITKIRARRAATETKKAKAIEKARLLIAEAEKAAEALEMAATTSPIARASLVEARKLIAEATRLVETAESGRKIESCNGSGSGIGSSEDEDLNLRKLSLLKGENGGLNGSVTRGSSPLPNGCDMKGDLPCKPVTGTKRWVRGRLVEVTTKGD